MWERQDVWLQLKGLGQVIPKDVDQGVTGALLPGHAVLRGVAEARSDAAQHAQGGSHGKDTTGLGFVFQL